MHAKSRTIKTFIANFLTILLNEFPVALDSPVFMRLSFKLIHDLNTHTTHSSAQMLYNVKSIKNNFSVWKKLSSQVIIRVKHIHSNDFHSTSDRTLIFKH